MPIENVQISCLLLTNCRVQKSSPSLRVGGRNVHCYRQTQQEPVQEEPVQEEPVQEEEEEQPEQEEPLLVGVVQQEHQPHDVVCAQKKITFIRK